MIGTIIFIIFMNCELCGKESGLKKVRIEGSIFNVCNGCSSYGSVVAESGYVKPKRFVVRAEKVEDLIVDYGSVIRGNRNQKGLSQEDFAKMLKIKISVLKSIESGKGLDVGLAKRLEKALGVELVVVMSSGGRGSVLSDVKGGEVTIGDLIGKGWK